MPPRTALASIVAVALLLGWLRSADGSHRRVPPPRAGPPYVGSWVSCRGNADQSYTEQVPDTGLALEHRLTGFEARLGASRLEALASVYDGGQQRSQQVALEPLDDGPARPRYANVSFSETSTVFAVTVCCAAGGADSGGGAVQVQGLKFEVEESGAWQRLQLGERCDRSAGNYGVDVQQERLAGIAVRTVGEGPTARVVAVALVTVDLPRPPPPPPFTVWSDVTAPPLSWELHLPPPMDDLAAPPDAPEGADGEAPLPPPPHLVAVPTEPPSAEARPPPTSPSPGASTWAPPPQLPRAVAVAVSAGHFHTCALTDSGTVLCWGTNRFGQLGYAADPNAYGIPPRPLPLTAAAVGVAASGDNTCALLAGGSVQCFGAEAEGQLFELRLPPGERVASVALSRLTLEDGAGLCALLQPSGRVVCRDAYDPDPPVNAALARLGPASRLAGSTLFLCGVFSSSLFCWRYSPIQRAFTEPQLLNLGSLDVADVALNYLHGCVKCFGSNVYGQLGYGDTLLRSPTAPGTVFADVDLGPGLRAVALSLGDAHSCALCSTDAADGSEAMVVKCWGRNSDGRLGLGDNATRGDRPGTMGAALPSVDLGPGRSPVAIAAGSWHTCALTQPGGQMLCWGDNLSRQLPGVTGESVGMRPEDMGSGLRAIDLGAWPSALPPTPAAGAKPPLPPQPQPAAPRQPPEHRCVFILNKKEARLRCWATGGTGADASLLEVLVGRDLLPRLNATGVDLKPRDPSYPLVMLDEQQRPAIPSDAPDLGLTFRDMARLHLLDSSVMGVPLGPGGPLVQCLNCIEVVFTNCTFGLLSGQVPAWRRGVGGSGSPPRYLDGASVPELLRDASSSAIVNGSVLTYFYPSYVVHGPVHLSGLRRASFRRLQCHDVYNAHGWGCVFVQFAKDARGTLEVERSRIMRTNVTWGGAYGSVAGAGLALDPNGITSSPEARVLGYGAFIVDGSLAFSVDVNFARVLAVITSTIGKGAFLSVLGTARGAVAFNAVQLHWSLGIPIFIGGSLTTFWVHGSKATRLNATEYVNEYFDGLGYGLEFWGRHPSDGGFVHVQDGLGTFELTNSSISYSRATRGGVVFASYLERVVLTNATLRSNVALVSGGCFYVNGSRGDNGILPAPGTPVALLEVTGSVVERNAALSGHGGVLASLVDVSAVLLSNNSLVRYNRARTSGGVLYVQDSINSMWVESGSQVVDNVAFTGLGGAIHALNNATLVLLSGARMSRNFAREDGGAAFCGGTADVSLDSAAAMEGNLAAPGSGGAVSAARCRLRMAGGAALEGNAAGKHGGGLHCGQLEGDLELASGTRMEGNSAAGDGGALFLASSGRLVASAAVIRRNRAGQRGGVVFSASDLDLDLTAGSTVEHNAANRTGGMAFAQGSISRLALAGGSVVLNNTARWGGAISCEGDAGSIAVSSSSRISSNAATHGAGGAMWFGSSLGTLVINGSSSLPNNSAASEGGAMWVAGTTDSIVVAGNSSVSGNTARKGSGGAITVLEALGTLQLLGSEARGNGAATSGGFLNAPGGVGLLYILYGSVVAGNTGSDGGAVFASSIGQFAANGSSLVGNVARGEGGALYVSGSVSALTFGPGALLEGNRAEAGGGGATFVAGSTDLVSAQGARVLANSAATEGGAFRLAHVARMVLDNTTFTANTAHSSGGGAVRVDSAGQLDLIGCLLSDNAAATDGGFAAIATAASVTVTASVLRNNSAGMDGGALFLGGLGGPLAIRASRLEHNTAGALGGAVFTASALAVSGAAFVGNEAREGGALYALLHPGAAPAAVSSSKSATVGAVPLNLAVGQNVCPADVPMPTACGAPAAHPGEVVCSCFEGNVAAQAGGAIGGSVAATADGAGAAAGNSSSRFRVVSSVFVTNHAGALGGAVSLASSGPVPAAPLELLLDGSSARGNGVGGSGSAEGCGGAVHVAGGGRALRITGASELTQNRAGYGGAVCALGAARVVVEDSTISANRAEAGGGCFVDGGGGDGTTTITASAAPSGSRTLFLAANTSLSGNRAVLSSSSSTLRFSGHGGALLLLGSTAAALAAVDMAASAADVAGAGVASLQNMRSCVASSGGAAAAIQQAGGISREAAAEVQVASAGQGWGSGEAIRALQAAAEAQCWLLAVRLRQSGLPDAKLASTALGPSRLSERLIWMDDPRAESLAISCAPAQGSASQAGEDDAADTAALVREALASPGTLGRNSSSEERRQPLLLGCGTDSGATPTWAGAAEGSVLSDILALPPSRLQLTVDGRVVSEPAQAPLVWRPGAPGRLSAMLVDDWGRPVREHAPATLGLRLGPDAWAALQLAPQEPALAAGVGEWSSVIATGWTGSGYTLTLPPLVLPLSLSACRLGEELALGAGEDPGAQAAGSTCRACRPQQFTLWRDPRSEREPPRPPASAVNDSGAAGGGGGGGWASALAAESGCLLCPANAFCPGGAVVVPRQGFWASSPMSTQVHRCLKPDACDPTAEGLAPWLAEAAARIEAAQPIDAEVGGALAACKQAWYASAPPGAAALANLTTAAGAGNSPNASLCLLDGVPYDSAQSYMQRQCAEGYGGPLCAVCAPSHYLTPDSECARCPSVGATAALVAVACAASTALILGSVWSALAEDYTRGEEGARPEAVDVVKVLVVHIQYLVIITRLSLGWPAPIGRLQALLGAVTGAGDLLAFSPACLAPAGAGEAGRVRAQVLGALALPLAAAGLALLLWAVRYRLWNQAVLRRQGKPLSRRRRDSDGGAEADVLAEDEDVPRIKRGAEAAMFSKGYPGEKEPAADLSDAGTGGPPEEPDGSDSKAAADEGKGMVPSGPEPVGDSAGGGGGPGSRALVRRVRRLVSRLQLALTPQSSIVHLDQAMPLRRQLLVVGLMSAFILYPALVQVSLSMFACRTLDSGEGPYADLQRATWSYGYWVRYMQLECYTGPHLQQYVPLGVACVLLFCALPPAALFALLWRQRHRLDEQRTKLQYGFAYRRYRPRWFMFECVLQLETLALVLADVFTRTLQAHQQALLLLAVLLLIGVVNISANPLRMRLLTLMEFLSLMALCLTLTLGLYFVPTGSEDSGLSSQAAEDAVGILILILNAALMAAFVALLVKPGLGRAWTRHCGSLAELCGRLAASGQGACGACDWRRCWWAPGTAAGEEQESGAEAVQAAAEAAGEGEAEWGCDADGREDATADGGCSQCQEHEEIERYCADTGFKELLRCTTNQKLAEDWPVVLTYPYPPDVHIADDEDQSEAKAKADAQGGSGSGPKMIRVVRSCTEKTVEQHQKALADEVAAADALYGGTGVGMVGGMGFGGRHMGLFNYELVMVVLLGLSLPVVYWRKIRIRHL